MKLIIQKTDLITTAFKINEGPYYSFVNLFS